MYKGVIIMIILTIENVPGKEIKEVKGLVKGSTVRCKNIGRDITASFKNLVGGEMSGYNDMLTEARQIAIGRMVDEAEAMGANAIIGMKLMSSAIAAGAAEMVAYGTAVVVEYKGVIYFEYNIDDYIIRWVLDTYSYRINSNDNMGYSK